jgi:protoporphyrinogen IX oxidase
MLILKAFHIIAVIAWFAALFYLPRLFVYHTQVDKSDKDNYSRFTTMEYKLYYIIAMPALCMVVIFGILTALSSFEYRNHELIWPYIKYIFVLLVIAFHFSCGYFMRVFKAGNNQRTEKFYRYFNEIPTILLIVIVLLSVVKPF